MKQFCIIGTGRSGSSLLASIMAQSDASFALDTQTDWDAVKGSMEHPLAARAYAYIHKLRMIERTFLPTVFFRSFFTKRLNQTLASLATIPYVKSSKLVYVVPYLARVNPDVEVVVVYRDFLSYARSRHAKYGWDMNQLCDEYCNAYSTALLQVTIWGGTVIAYNNIIDPANNDWAEALADQTGLDATQLVAARDATLKSPTKPAENMGIPVPDRVRDIEAQLQTASRRFV